MSSAVTTVMPELAVMLELARCAIDVELAVNHLRADAQCDVLDVADRSLTWVLNVAGSLLTMVTESLTAKYRTNGIRQIQLVCHVPRPDTGVRGHRPWHSKR
jgi:hypothetical protein